MAWEQQSQYRHQYSLEGSRSMAWQPTAVYRPDRPTQKKGEESSFGGMLDTVSMLLALFAAFIVYHEVGKIHFVAHLSSGIRPVILWGAAGFTFLSTAILASTRIVRVLMGLGISLFCAALFFWPALLSFK